ncbi:MAG: Carboxyl-terminal protease [uncultured bacterium]|uniref:PDZ domain-containing protein n=1 Tax=candidate division WWE3 bacterium RBG_16_37_10 TaxID=1802610 RepID=A0A1F4V1L0_UNCKA|nr:MAG: Carboxyl-terminal protease [uncultured bacterium]OGC51058.1 MAG: hypothetical protein A2W32_02330 [candidate division WWE3 bacterium RBG_16_37_10]
MNPYGEFEKSLISDGPQLRFQKKLGVLLTFIGLFFSGYFLGVSGYEFDAAVQPFSLSVERKIPVSSDVDFNKFWEKWDYLIADKSKDEVKKMYYESISGMVESLGDPYTSFLAPPVNEVVNNAINGTYEGIGAELGFNQEDKLIVISPLDGSPAINAGIRPGDRILKIDGEDTEGISLNEAVAQIRGESGTFVTLTIRRDDKEPQDIRIKRGVITVASVTWKDMGEGTVYLKVSRFGGDTNKEWDKAVSEINIKVNELDALVIDLRGNPGGYLESAVHLAGEFYRNKPVLYRETALGEQFEMKTNRNGFFTQVPAVFVLIDGGSASASEILAAALKSQINATLVGEKSFGKGTIQDAENFKDGSGLHITIEKWLTPEKVWVHKKQDIEGGIQPDITVEMSDEDIKAGLDKQLDKAVELSKQI